METHPFDLPTDEYQRVNGKWHWHGKKCKGADDATFTPCNNVWATDSKGVFKQECRLRAADPLGCRPLNLLFAKDSTNVYYIEGTAKAVVDVPGFQVLDSGQYLQVYGFEKRFG